MSKKIKVSSKKAVKKGSATKAPAKNASPSSKKTAGKPPVKKPLVPTKKAAPVSKKSAGKSAPKPAVKKIVTSGKKSASKPVKKVVAAKKAPGKTTVKPAGKKPIALAKPSSPAKAGKKTLSPPHSAPKKKVEPKASGKTSIAAKAVKQVAPAKKIAVKATVKAPVKIETKKPVISPPAKTLGTSTPTKSPENTKKAAAEARSGEVLAINNTIPVAKKHEISLSKIASISQSITNPIRRNDSYAVKVEKEPNGKFELEFVFHASGEMLYEFVSTASGLSEWFCDDLNIRNGIYTFIWDDQLQQARLLKTIDLQLVRFQWVEKTDGSYFEFRIQRDDLTNDIALIVTDFADSNSERESSKLLWNSQIEKLRHVLGSIF